MRTTPTPLPVLRTCLLILSLLLLPTGCASNPMGLSDAEWNALSPKRQAELRAEQYRINEHRRIEREAEARRRAEEAAAEKREQQRTLAERRTNARYGDIITVALQGGAIEYRDKQYPCSPIAFALLRGESKRINLVGSIQKGHSDEWVDQSWWVRFSEDGNSLYLNDSPAEIPIVLVNDGSWERGGTKLLRSGGRERARGINLFGMTAHIRFKELPGMPERVIIERR